MIHKMSNPYIYNVRAHVRNIIYSRAREKAHSLILFSISILIGGIFDDFKKSFYRLWIITHPNSRSITLKSMVGDLSRFYKI